MGTFDPARFVAQGAESLGKKADDQVANVATLESLPLEQMEQDALTAVMGDGWKTLTVPQLQQKIQDLRQSEFSRTQAIRAELATAQGSRRIQLLQQLKEAGATGVTATEDTVQELQKQVESADTVSFGGEDYKVADLLADGEISDLVTRMLTDPKLMQRVSDSNLEFAQWVQNNAGSLTKLAADVASGTESLNKIQTTKEKLATIAEGVTLSDTIMNAIVPGWNKVSGSVPEIKSGLYSVLTNPKLNEAVRGEMVAALTRASLDPAELRKIAALDANTFQMSFDLANAVEEDPLLAQLVDLGGDENFITDPIKQREVMRYKETTDALEAATKGAATGYAAALASPELLDFIKSGDFTAEHVGLLAAHPERLTEYTSHLQTMKDLKALIKTGDVDKMLDIVFGRDVDLVQINKEYARALRVVQLNPGDQEAQARLRTLSKFDSNKDGKLDKKDASKIAVVGMNDSMPDGGGGSSSLDQMLKLGGKKDLPGEFTKNKLDMVVNTKGLIDDMEAVMSDGNVTVEELDGQPASVIDAFMRNTGLAKKYGYSKIALQDLRDKKSTDEQSKKIQTEISRMNLPIPSMETSEWEVWVRRQTQAGKKSEIYAISKWLNDQTKIHSDNPALVKFFTQKSRELYNSWKFTKDAMDRDALKLKTEAQKANDAAMLAAQTKVGNKAVSSTKNPDDSFLHKIAGGL